MSKPSVEEIVAEFEKYGDLDQMRTTEVRSLIADWRKRGEALADIAKQNTSAELYEECGEDWGDFQFSYDCLVAVARSALTPPRPAESKPISPHQEK